MSSAVIVVMDDCAGGGDGGGGAESRLCSAQAGSHASNTAVTSFSMRDPLTLLGAYENHAVRAPRAVERGTGRILEHGDRLDIIAVDRVQVAGSIGGQRNAVEHDEHFRTGAPQTDDALTVVVAYDREPGNARQQYLLERHAWLALDIRGGDDGSRAARGRRGTSSGRLIAGTRDQQQCGDSEGAG